MLGALALGQAAWAGVTAYNDFGAPSLRNNSISRIGATLAELKASNGSVVKTGTLINFTSGQFSGINLKLTVTGSPLGQTEIGTEPPAETEAGMVFGNRVNCEGGTLLPAGKVHFIDLSGLDTAKRYELVLFASDATGGEAKPVSFTLWDVSSFENRSAGRVRAFNAHSGRKLWSEAGPGRALGLAVANGALLVSTDTGAIISFGQADDQPSGWILF